jgi:cell division protein FtsB
MVKNDRYKYAKPRRSIAWRRLLVIGVAVFVLIQFANQVVVYREAKAEVLKYQEELTAVQTGYEDLQVQKELLFNNSYLEVLAREKLGMIRAGETVISPADKSKEVIQKTEVDSKDIMH